MVLANLQKILDGWIKGCAISKFDGQTERDRRIIEKAAVKIAPFGSYKIGVMSPTSDIDCVVICP